MDTLINNSDSQTLSTLSLSTTKDGPSLEEELYFHDPYPHPNFKRSWTANYTVSDLSALCILRQSRLLSLPAEIRQEILAYVLPSDSVIQYKCPYGLLRHDWILPRAFPLNRKHFPSKSKPILSIPEASTSNSKGLPSNSKGYHTHRSCGCGPAWSCSRPFVHRNMSIMRTCRFLYEDCVQVLYGKRIFEIEIGGRNGKGWLGGYGVALWTGNLDLLFTRGGDGRCPHKGEAVRRFYGMKWDIMRGIRIIIEVNQKRWRGVVRALTWLCRTLASLGGDDGLKRVEVWLYFQDNFVRRSFIWTSDDRQNPWCNIDNGLTRLLIPLKPLAGKVREWGVGEMLDWLAWKPGNVTSEVTWVVRKTMKEPSTRLGTRCSKVAEQSIIAENGMPFTFWHVREYLWWLLTEQFQRMEARRHENIRPNDVV